MIDRRRLSTLLLLLFAFCSRPEKEIVYRRFVIGADCEVKFYCFDTLRAAQIRGAIDRELFRLDSLLSRFSDISLVSEINQNRKAALPPDLIPLFELCDSMSVVTSGRFDISVAPLVDLWGFYRRNHRVPDSAEIARKKELVNHGRIKLTEDSIFIPDNMTIDLGGIAQAYAADCIIARLKGHDIRRALVNIGGEIAALGRSAKNRPWRIGIKHPRASGIIEIVELEDNALSTSGDYEKFFEIGNRRYAHIINPLTGFPADDFASVTIFHERASIADALATAVAIMGAENGLKFLDSLGIRGIIYYVREDRLWRLETITK